MKLLLDEMWPPELAVQLRMRGHDVIAVAERVDLRTQPDEVIFVAATAEGRAIVTENIADFRPLAVTALNAGDSHAGLIFTTNHRWPRHDPRMVGRLLTALDALLATEPELTDQEHWI